MRSRLIDNHDSFFHLDALDLFLDPLLVLSVSPKRLDLRVNAHDVCRRCLADRLNLRFK